MSAPTAAATYTQAQRASAAAATAVLDQGYGPECVAYACCGARAYLDALGGAAAAYDPSFVWVVGDGTARGMQLLDGAQILLGQGCLPAADGPVVGAPTPAQLASASAHRIGSIQAVTLGGDGTVGANYAALCEAVDQGPVLLAVPAGGIQMPAQGPVTPGQPTNVFADWPAPVGATGGSHAVWAWDYAVINGRPSVRIRNSDGPGYGMAGDVWLDASYPIQQALLLTMAATAAAPDPTAAPTPTPPVAVAPAAPTTAQASPDAAAAIAALTQAQAAIQAALAALQP